MTSYSSKGQGVHLIFTIEVRWTPNSPQSLSSSLYLTLTHFLFEMQNVTACVFYCSIFNNLIPIKNSYFNDYHSLSDISKGNVQVGAMDAHLLFSI